MQVQFNYTSTKEELTGIASFDLLENLHNKRVLALLREGVEKLPEKCKLIFKYSREEHKSAKEIADELQISTITVENQLNKALGRLRSVIKNLNILFFSLL